MNISVCYVNHIEAVLKDNKGSFKGIEFISDNDKHVYIDGRVINRSVLDNMLTSGTLLEIKALSSNKLPPLNSVIVFTNGANNTLGTLDLNTNTYKVKGGGGHLGVQDISQSLAYVYSRVLSNDIKVYKIEGMKI